MNNVTAYSFEACTVRIVSGPDGEPRWVAKDVAEALGYVWNGAARIQHVPEEWRGVTSVVTPFGTQEMAVLTEQGLYFFLGRSDKPSALPFQKWIAGNVLPAIRKTGGYHTRPGGAIEAENNPDRLRAFAGLLVRKASLLEQLRDVEAAMAEGGAEAQPQRPPVTSRHRDIIERIREIARPRERTSTTEVVALLGVERSRAIEMLISEILRDEGFRRIKPMRGGKREWMYERR